MIAAGIFAVALGAYALVAAVRRRWVRAAVGAVVSGLLGVGAYGFYLNTCDGLVGEVQRISRELEPGNPVVVIFDYAQTSGAGAATECLGTARWARGQERPVKFGVETVGGQQLVVFGPPDA